MGSDYTPPPFPSNRKFSRFRNCVSVAGNGFMMGAALGVSFGILIGGVSVMNPRYAGQRVALMSSTCMQMGGVFGSFLAVGSIIRGGC